MAELSTGDVVQLDSIVNLIYQSDEDRDEEEGYTDCLYLKGYKDNSVLIEISIPREGDIPIVDKEDLKTIAFTCISKNYTIDLSGSFLGEEINITLAKKTALRINSLCFKLMYKELDLNKISPALARTAAREAPQVENIYGPDDLYRYTAALLLQGLSGHQKVCSCGLKLTSNHLSLSKVEDDRMVNLTGYVKKDYMEYRDFESTTIFPYSFICAQTEREYLIVMKDNYPTRVVGIDSGWLS